ncbi:OmpH family outer membrane protein [Pedobacter sp. LMG 31464]|uniref:OmpH family outer membrane protein n=1 Tax=Pedobacter planticolens TaxID=2679964 RepID=A0A923E381_9SPHI|nr:OmpH family outer membrane protein [Pedobacter planticolens]MBB2147213.1 OmpH family outer membrane protein [Pedobacter planticolens]
MRKLINVFFVAAGLLLTANVANAQQKLGHLSSDEIYANMPEAKAAQATLETLAKTKQAEIDKMIAEYQVKYKAAQDKEKTLSEANKEVVGKELQIAGQEIQDLGKRIEDARTKATTDVQTKQGELFPPINQKLATAMSAVAKEKGLAYVFDTSVSQGFNSLVYFDGGEDITAAVKTKLGISNTPAATKPATTPAKKN